MCHTRLVFQLQVCRTSEATAVGSIGKFSRSFPIEAVKRFAVKMGGFGTGIHELSRRGLLSSLGSSSHSGTTSGLPASPYHTSSDRGGGVVCHFTRQSDSSLIITKFSIILTQMSFHVTSKEQP